MVAGDLTRPGAWQDAMRDSELVIHTAALVGMGADADAFWRANVLGTRNAVEAAARADYRASLATEDIGEALAAFKAKRPPVFRGR